MLLEPQGRNGRWGEDALCQQLAAAGRPVCAPDVRGIGDLSPEFPRHAPRHARPHQEEEHYAWASLMLGRPLLGQRVADLLAVAGSLAARADLAGRPMVLAATGKMTVPALFAAALYPGIDALYLSAGLVSLRDIVETESYNHPFSNFLPDVLRTADLPQLAASLAPRRVRLAGVVGAAGERLPPERVRAAYALAGNVEILPEHKWDLEALSSL